MKRVLAFLILFPLFPFATVIAQELNCTVTVNLESIPSAQRDYLRSFKDDLERYLNNTRFTTEDMLGDRIQCTMDVFFKSVVGDNRYQAQVFVGSQRPIYVGNDKSDKVTPVIRIMDGSWEFTYVPNQRMLQDDLTFDPLSDVLDFYAYMIIGFDLETYTPMSGSPYFRKALNICQQGAASSYSADWKLSTTTYSRSGLADELNNGKYNAFRTAFNSYHFDGLDLLATDRPAGLANMLKAIQTISDIRSRQNPTSILVKLFFDAKYKEIGDTFVGSGDYTVFDKLSELDEQHRSYYQDKKAGR